jgi:hypothetical protein
LGADLFLDLVQGTDAQAGSFWGFSGQYIDNTDIFTVMEAAMNPPFNNVNPEPEPFAGSEGQGNRTSF